MGTKLRHKISSNKDFTFVRLWIRSEYKSSVLFKNYLKMITDDYCKTRELSTIWEWYLNINDILRGLAASCFYNITCIMWCIFSSKRCIYLSYRFVIYQCILSHLISMLFCRNVTSLPLGDISFAFSELSLTVINVTVTFIKFLFSLTDIQLSCYCPS